MTDIVASAMIVAVPPTIVALSSLIVSLLNRKQAKATAEAVGQVHVMINSRMDEWLAAAKAIAHRAGQDEEIAKQQKD